MEPLSRASMMEFVLPGTLAVGMSLATWLVLPNVLRRCHRYVESGAKARVLGPEYADSVPFHQSVFGALEDPARLFAGALTFSYLGYLVAPKSLGAQYLGQIRSGCMVVSLIWFLYLYKRNVFTRITAGKHLDKADRERYLTMDRLSSIALLLLGCMAFAESCGVAVQSVLTVGGIGGVATAFAARDLLGNLLSGLGIQFSRPFAEGDYITAGDLSGQVVEIGLHSTEMLNHDKFPTIVPNSFFSSQVIVNRSRVKSRGLELNVPVKLTCLEKLPAITSEIRSMLDSNPQVFLEDEKPRCHVSQVNATSFNVIISCNFKSMSEDEFIVAQEAVLLEASRIVVRNDPDPDPDSDLAKSFSEGAEMVEKPLSSPESDHEPEHHESPTAEPVSVETTDAAALSKPDKEEGANLSSNGASLSSNCANLSSNGANLSSNRANSSSNRANSGLNRANSAPKRSPSLTKEVSDSLRRPESPKTPRTGVLGVGSKLLSRIRQTKR